MNHLTSSCLFFYLFTIYLYLLVTNTKIVLASYRPTTIANPTIMSARPPLPALLLNNNNNNNHNNHHNNNNNNNKEDDEAAAATSSKPAASKYNLASANRTNQQREHLNTIFACENNQIELTCQEGKLIHLARAIYGRFSVNICNDLGHSNLSVQCASFRAFLIMETRCNKLSNCTVIASKELFGDPCEGTSKYLEVQYYCDDANNNNNSNNNNQQQQQQQQSAPSPALQAAIGGGSSLTATTTTTTATSRPTPPPGAPSYSNGHKSQPPNQQVGGGSGELFVGKSATAIGNSDDTQPTEGSHATNVIVQREQQQQQQQLPASHLFCGPQASSRNLYWNYTRAGHKATQSCPDGSTGRASWFCDAERMRFRPAWSPDFSQCKSIWLQRLASQLDQLLESPSKLQQLSSPASELTIRQQSEQTLRTILNDLALMARTKELFSEDLKRIDIMIGQIINQLRSLSVSTSSALNSAGISWQQAFASNPSSNSNSNNNNNPSGSSLYEELFSKLVSIVSALFDMAQRSAWLEVQPNETRRRLEQRFLNHLKESGAMLAGSMGNNNQHNNNNNNNNNNQLPQQSADNHQQQPWRQANVFAAITVINNLFNSNNSPRFNFQDLETSSGNEFTLNPAAQSVNRQSQLNLNKLIAEPDEHINELRMHLSILKELVGDGITRFLILDIKKPDYSLIRQQLEFSYGAGLSTTNEPPFDNNLFAEQQWSSRVFGVFAVVGESGDILDGQREHKLVESLAQWPISVDFKVSQPMQLVQQLSAQQQQQQQQQQVARQCNSLASDGQMAQPQQNNNRCHTVKSNATNHICRCDQFGFLTLSNAPNQLMLQVPLAGGDFQWPPPALADGSYGELDLASSPAMGGSSQPDYINAPQNKSQQQPLGFWATTFIVMGLLLFVLTLAALIANATLRASAHSRLSKKQQNFLTGGAAAAAANMLADHHLGAGATSGPLADHSLISDDQLINSNGSGSNTNSAGGTTHSSSIIGLNAQSAQATNGYHNHDCYKAAAHQQLYAAHLPGQLSSLGLNPVGQRSRWASWADWLRPSRWLSGSASHSKELMIQHRIIGSPSLASAGSLAAGHHYKSQYQNGYTTNLHRSGLQTAGSGGGQMPQLNAPSSSTSSYVSSSAYYEEIGPGNLTRVNTNQLTSGARPTHTIVDPFKPRQPDQQQQQQLLSHQNNHVHHSLTQWPLDTGHQQHQNQLTQASCAQQASMLNIYKQFHTDLSQLQSNSANPQSSSTSSAGSSSQHSASTNLTTANGSTPRHYLFASPSAVTAYKSSMNHYPAAYHQQQQQHHHQ